MSTYYQPQTSFGLFPPVVKNLMIINGLVFLATMIPVLADPLIRYGAMWPLGTPEAAPRAGVMTRIPAFYPWQIVTSAFLHAGFGHIFFNMLGLWFFGVPLERVLGSKRFGILFAVSVIGAGLLQLGVISLPFLQGAAYFPAYTLGASGGVLGVLAAFAVLFPDEPIYLYFLVPIPAKWLVLGLVVLDLYAGVTGSQAGIANFAHVGGAIAGFVLILYWRNRHRMPRSLH